MPLTASGKKVLRRMQRQYGAKKGKQVYYATAAKEGRSERSFRKTSSPSGATRGRKKAATKHKSRRTR